MPTIIIPKKRYRDDDALKDVFNYVSDYAKSGGLIGAQNMLVDNSLEQAMAVNRYFYDNTEKKAIHFIISFASYECISPIDAFREGYKICNLLHEYQIKFAVHQNTDKLHIHFAMNPVSLIDGHKFYFDFDNISFFEEEVREILAPYGITRINTVFADDPNKFMFSKALN